MAVAAPTPTAEPQPPGVYPGVPFEEYFAWSKNISKHQLDVLQRSPAHYLAALAAPRKQTPGMAKGKAVHSIILEPDDFAQRYAPAPDIDKRTRAGKAAHEEAAVAGKTLLNADEWDAIQAMRDAVRAHPFAGILLNPADGESEISLSWIDAETGVYCRARPDFLNEAHGGLCIDLKTASDASMGEFSRACAKYNYHWQSAMYLDGLASVKKPHSNFVFVVVETEAPWAIGIYELAPDDLELGRTLYKRALRVYQECLESGIYASYPPEIRQLELPSWARIIPVR
jgi:hypothetical protein